MDGQVIIIMPQIVAGLQNERGLDCLTFKFGRKNTTRDAFHRFP